MRMGLVDADVNAVALLGRAAPIGPSDNGFGPAVDVRAAEHEGLGTELFDDVDLESYSAACDLDVLGTNAEHHLGRGTERLTWDRDYLIGQADAAVGDRSAEQIHRR